MTKEKQPMDVGCFSKFINKNEEVIHLFEQNGNSQETAVLLISIYSYRRLSMTTNPYHPSNLFRCNVEDNQIYHLVYMTTNLINGKIYVGKHSTRNLDDG